MRLLILLGLLYLCYRFVKSWVLKEKSSQEVTSGKRSGELDDVMVQDPFCGVYFAKKDGVSLNIAGKDVYFCSAECKEKFLEKQAGKES